MKNILLTACFLLFSLGAIAQQDAMYSQYMFNGLVLNPAYAGSREAVSISALARTQWLGIPGAPNTQNISLHTPSRNRKHGFGITLVNDQIAYLGQTWLNLSYAYRIQMKTGTLALGLQGTFYNYRINWNKAVTINPNDPVPLMYGRNLNLPNAGFGVFYNTDRFYAGLSIPHLLINSLDNQQPGLTLSETKFDKAWLKRHYFVTAGYVIDLSKDVKLKPSFLFKYVYAAPMELDLNANVYFNNKWGVGASYRTGDGIIGLFEYQINQQLKIGYAYDYPFTELRKYTSGTHEIAITYDFIFGNDAVVSPRVF
ncbi:MAG: type IX secretion system membrane protein PorP/SprF [Bacteroidia bacterium]|nr:type IX secretion system membrane protein PorP/SprF [Bacteroidia bacterium]